MRGLPAVLLVSLVLTPALVRGTDARSSRMRRSAPRVYIDLDNLALDGETSETDPRLANLRKLGRSTAANRVQVQDYLSDHFRNTGRVAIIGSPHLETRSGVPTTAKAPFRRGPGARLTVLPRVVGNKIVTTVRYTSGERGFRERRETFTLAPEEWFVLLIRPDKTDKMLNAWWFTPRLKPLGFRSP